MQIISRAKFIDDLVVMYDIEEYKQLEKIHKIIDSVIGKDADDISVAASSRIMMQTDKLFKMRRE